MTHPVTRPERGFSTAEGRSEKGRAILDVIAQSYAHPLSQADFLDLGCGSGGIAEAIAPEVKSVLGVDPNPWPEWAAALASHANLRLETALPTSGGAAFDVIICNQVYEHVDDPIGLINNIHTLLRDDGICYFAGPNRLFPIEPHVFWPFVHWLPPKWGQALMRLCGSKKILDARSTHYWELRRWLSAFDVKNALPFIIHHQAKLRRSRLGTGVLAGVAASMPTWLIEWLTPLAPGFVFILRKRRTD